MAKKSFINDNFLLENSYAEALYHDYAAKQPIIDYHNHLPPKEIAEDRTFENISRVWLNGDHYKWRAMRTLGVDEKYITGNASDQEKFEAWARTVPATLRNPLYHWTHLELKRYFGVDELLNESNGTEIYQEVNRQLQESENSCRGLLKQMNVVKLCTTEDPTDQLPYHQQLHNSDCEIKVSTAFRPDKAVLIDSENYTAYLDELREAAGLEIGNYGQLKEALKKRIDYFHKMGCRLCDHGLNSMSFETFSDQEIEQIFSKKRNGENLSALEVEKFKTAILLFLCETYHEKGWVQQFHLGALRNNNKRMLSRLGPDTGWDSIGDFSQTQSLSNFLNELDGKDKLAKTIIYNLNPADNAAFATMIGNFNDGSVKGKIQFGSGWWFLDQKDGIIEQLNALSNMGLISCFIGMLTDSRSFLSFPRHEYFRRVLSNLFGQEMQRGELPDDMELVGKTIADISYHNAENYFDF
ncbi:glucuronate isomerase [Christiangramia flava]|uniref:Uronate isomerase n=1 Tax=Christiangramia flava JLT2011 TaxID=1229726 RepID=A0A1L7I5K9_9FLAO|nr:glucuronate isomerase [Christiangramia flava]APU68888.1 Uronate isomerase [Christiangramia flava JLT2011]OSS38966.1 Uronate isomerase [Christiangramia flava JLT2011]